MYNYFVILCFRLKDVIAKRGKGLGGDKAVSETAYKKILEKNFAAVHGQITPKWAELGKKDDKKLKRNSDDEEDTDDQNLSKV